MKQLVQLQQHADEFKKLNAEMLFVFREEQEGVDGLKKIKAKHNTSFTLAVDLNKKSSNAYSSQRMTFDNYVIDSQGIVRASIDGTLKVRATTEQLKKVLQEIESSKN